MKKIVILLSILAISTGNKKEYCDIKGNIKNPGVYEIKENYTIQDIINDAGGLKKNSYTNNINLSKKVTDEMVIYIFTNEEIKNANKLNNCTCSPKYKYIECEEEKENNKLESMPTTNTTTTTTTTITSTTSKVTTSQHTSSITTTKKQEQKININTASLEELISLNGLGETKAQHIIEYRNANGLFNTIEDILKVKGIGQSTFENIKEFIKV